MPLPVAFVHGDVGADGRDGRVGRERLAHEVQRALDGAVSLPSAYRGLDRLPALMRVEADEFGPAEQHRQAAGGGVLRVGKCVGE